MVPVVFDARFEHRRKLRKENRGNKGKSVTFGFATSEATEKPSILMLKSPLFRKLLKLIFGRPFVSTLTEQSVLHDFKCAGSPHTAPLAMEQISADRKNIK